MPQATILPIGRVFGHCGVRDPHRLRAEAAFAELLRRAGNSAQARGILEQAVTELRSLRGPDDAWALFAEERLRLAANRP